MITINQSNYINDKLRQLEREVQQKTGLNLTFGVYSGSKKIIPTLSCSNALEQMLLGMGCCVATFKGGARNLDYVLARKVVAHILRENFKTDLVEIAAIIGYSHHSSAIRSLNSATDLINSEDERFMFFYQQAMAAIEVKQ